MSEGHTERSMLDLLHRRYGTIPRNFPPRYILADHVRQDANWANRTADCIVQDTWTGCSEKRFSNLHLAYPIHGFEVKTSRSDWLTELRDPEKAQAFIPFVHYWWLVVPDKSLVKLDELPNGWGLLAIRGRGLGQIVAPSLNKSIQTMPHGMRVGLMRSVIKTQQPTHKKGIEQ